MSPISFILFGIYCKENYNRKSKFDVIILFLILTKLGTFNFFNIPNKPKNVIIDISHLIWQWKIANNINFNHFPILSFLWFVKKISLFTSFQKLLNRKISKLCKLNLSYVSLIFNMKLFLKKMFFFFLIRKLIFLSKIKLRIKITAKIFHLNWYIRNVNKQFFKFHAKPTFFF